MRHGQPTEQNGFCDDCGEWYWADKGKVVKHPKPASVCLSCWDERNAKAGKTRSANARKRKNGPFQLGLF